jgi:hypothetical protein
MFKEVAEGIIADLNAPSSLFELFTGDNIGTLVDSGTDPVPVHNVYGRIRVQGPVSKAKRCTYLDWKPGAGD